MAVWRVGRMWSFREGVDIVVDRLFSRAEKGPGPR